MVTNIDIDALAKTLHETERLVEQLRNATAHAFDRDRLQMNELVKRLAPDLEALQKAAAEAAALARKALAGDAAALENAAAEAAEAARQSLDFRALQEVRDNARLLSGQFQSLAGDLNSAIATALAQRHAETKGRSLSSWRRRWKRDASAAEGAFAPLADATKAAQDHGDLPAVAFFLPSISTKDVDIAELYYNGQLTQQQVGEAVGLTQASVASRLKKVDKIIAREVLVRCLHRVATEEGWDITAEESVHVGGFSVQFDLLATPTGTSGIKARLGIDIHIVSSNTHWTSSVDRIQGWSEYLASIEPQVFPALALYDLSEHTAYLCLETDLEEAASRVHPERISTERIRFRVVRPLLPQSLSLNDALKRATR